MHENLQTEMNSTNSLREIQFERLKQTISWVSKKSPFYREKFRSHGIQPEDLTVLEDLGKFPFTTLKELRDTAAGDFLTLPYSSIVRVNLWEHPQPIVRMYTQRDIAINVEILTRALTAYQVSRGSLVGILGDLADSGLMDALDAVEKIGATAIPLSTEYERTIRLLDEIGIDTIIGSSRRVLRLVVQAQAMGKDIAEYPANKILCLSETLNTPLKNHIENRTNTRVYNLFSTAEFGCIGMLYSCSSHAGQHFQEDFFYPEIVAFGGDEVIHDAEQMGELVVTTLAAEALPIIRGRTGQTVMREAAPCSCGRTLLRLTTPLGF